MAASVYYGISKEEKNASWDTIELLDTHVCINSPHWQRSGILIIFCKYCIVILDTLRGSFLIILSELYEKRRRNEDSVTEKST